MDHQLSLRQGRYKVTLIGINSQYEPPIQFALSYPNSDNPYADIITSWGKSADSVRGDFQQSVDIPLGKRTQTFLSHQVSPELAQQLRGFYQPKPNTGREGSRHHRIEINTHQSNQVSIHQKTQTQRFGFQGGSQFDGRQSRRESIVTHLATPDPSSDQRCKTARCF